MDLPRRHNRALAISLGSIVFLVAICTLPYRVPVAKVYSASYVFGYNNRLAALLTAAGVVLLALFGPKLDLRFTPGKPLTASTLRKALAIAGSLTVVLHGMTRRLDGVAESIYLIDRIKLLREGRVPYKQFEYAYGASFLYGPSWIARWFHLPIGDGYGVFWFALVLLGTYLLYQCIVWVEFPNGAQRSIFLFFWAFSLLNLFTFGITYSLFRYALPCFLALVLTRRLADTGRSPMATLLLPAPMYAVLLLVSPELAIGFAVGMYAFLWHFGRLGNKGNLTAFVVGLGTMGAVSYVAARYGIFYTLAAFSHGGFNFPVMPAPHLLLFFLLTGLAACYAGQRLRTGKPDALLALVAVSVCSLAAALGRCDPLHVLFNPLGVMLAGSFLMAGLPLRIVAWPAMWFVFILLFFVTIMTESGMQLEKAALPAILTLTPTQYASHVDHVVLAHMTKALGPTVAKAKFDNMEATLSKRSYDIPEIFGLPAGTVVEAPFGFAPGGFGTYHSPLMDEGYYFENENVLTPEAVARKASEMRLHPERPLLLLPGRENACTVEVTAGPPSIGPPFFYPYTGKPVHDNDVSEPICATIREHYSLARHESPETFGYQVWLPK